MRFVKMSTGNGEWTVYDNVYLRGVPGMSGSTEVEAQSVQDILNQRVERPELTRADGKLVTA
jgi:hypothetical protein